MWSMSEELTQLTDWFKANKLTLNLSKSVCMLFTEKPLKVVPQIEVCGSTLPFVEQTKFLGVWIDSKLTWKPHVNKLLVKLKQNMVLLKTGDNFMNIHCKKLVYYSHIQSHLSYCLGVWGNHIPVSILTKLKNTQRKCLDLISRNKTQKELGILSVNDLIKLENLKFCYKLMNSDLPIEVQSCATTNNKGNTLVKSHCYNTRNKDVPNTPSAKNKKIPCQCIL